MIDRQENAREIEFAKERREEREREGRASVVITSQHSGSLL